MRTLISIVSLSIVLIGFSIALLGGYLTPEDRENITFSETFGGTRPAEAGDAPRPARALDLVFSADGDTVVARQADGQIVAWSRASGDSVVLAETEGAFAYCPAKGRLVLSMAETTVALSLVDGVFEQAAAEAHDHAAFNADCSTLALARTGATGLRVLRDGVEDPTLLTTSLPIANGLVVSPDGQRVVASIASDPGSDAQRTSLEVFQIAQPDQPPVSASDGNVDIGGWSLAFGTGGLGILAGSETLGQGGFRRFDAESGALVWARDGAGISRIQSIAAGPGGTYLATGDDLGHLRLWDAESGVMLADKRVGGAIVSVAFSPDGALIASGLEDGTIGIVTLGSMF